MKRVLLVFLVIMSFLLVGCGEKTFAYSTIQQDAYNTGGNLSFVYESETHTAYFGGRGEFIDFYGEDVAKGWKESGNRLGFTLAVPQGVDDVMSATASLNGKNMEAGEFIAGKTNQYAFFQPVIDENMQLLTLKIKWQSGAKEQVYNIVIKEGTVLLKQ